MAGDQRKVVEKGGPVDCFEFGLHFAEHGGYCLLQIVQAIEDGVQEYLQLFLLTGHGGAANYWSWIGALIHENKNNCVDV